MLDQSKNNVKSLFSLEKLLNKGTAKLLVTKNDKKDGTFVSGEIKVRVFINGVAIFIGNDLEVNLL